MAVAPFRWCQVRPTDATRDEILPVVSHHLQKCVIGLDDATFKIGDEDADNVSLDQAPDSRLTFLKFAVQPSVLERCRRLRGEKLQNCDAGGRKNTRSK